jgi:hypothetical protein
MAETHHRKTKQATDDRHCHHPIWPVCFTTARHGTEHPHFQSAAKPSKEDGDNHSKPLIVSIAMTGQATTKPPLQLQRCFKAK